MKTHPHAAFLAEALNNMDREIEGKHRTDEWEPSNINHVIACAESWQFRFKPIKPAIVSTLTNEELESIWHGLYMDNTERRRAIANAASAAERKRIAELPAVTSLDKDELSLAYYPPHTGMAMSDMNRQYSLAIAAIAQFQRDLMEGL